MRWAIQTTNIATQQATLIHDAVKELGKPYVFADPYPFSEELVEEVEGQDLIPYGSTTLMKIAMKRGWKGLAFDPEEFLCDWWGEQRDDMLNADGHCDTIARASVFASLKPKDENVFIRPVGDFKLFSGTLTTYGEMAKWLQSVHAENQGFSPHGDIVWIASPKNIYAEWRCFVIDGNVVSTSMYRCEGRMTVQKETNSALLYQFKRMVTKWLPHKNVVMDVALSDEGFRVIEFNCINSSGFYDHDISLIVRALDRSYNE